MPSALFDFFEVVADELTSEPTRVITSEEVRARNQESALLDNLQAEMNAGTSDDAIDRAAAALRAHFQGKSASVPFDYDPETARFTATDMDYLEFINEMRSIRSIGKRSRDFECNVATWLGRRATGSIHRV